MQRYHIKGQSNLRVRIFKNNPMSEKESSYADFHHRIINLLIGARVYSTMWGCSASKNISSDKMSAALVTVPSKSIASAGVTTVFRIFFIF